MKSAYILSLLSLSVATACIDTSVPDLSSQLGTGPTDGPYCSPSEIEILEPETLKIHIIDVGQGDAIWVQTPYYLDQELESRQVLIDTGGTPVGDYPGGLAVVDYLRTHGFEAGVRLDAVIITHAHSDHYGGLEDIAAHFEVGAYCDSGYTGDSGFFAQTRDEVMTTVMANGGQNFTPAVPNLVAQWYEPIGLFGDILEARLLSASDTVSSSSEVNNTSVVVSLLWRGRRVLLMGDAEEAVERRLVAAAQAGEVELQASILKVGHHGSNTSSTEDFLEAVFPVKDDEFSWAVISSGRQEFSGQTLPREETVEALHDRLADHHVLSTANRDEGVAYGAEHGDDHVIVTVSPDGRTRACYAP